jgi:hypothetical protein
MLQKRIDVMRLSRKTLAIDVSRRVSWTAFSPTYVC